MFCSYIIKLQEYTQKYDNLEPVYRFKFEIFQIWNHFLDAYG